jgi:hypothetical protein
MNQPESKFTKHAKKQMTRSDDSREMSPAERLTRARQAVRPTDERGQHQIWHGSRREVTPQTSDNDRKNAFDRQAPNTKRTFVLVETPALTAAREAYEAEKKAKNAPVTPPPTQLDRHDILAMFSAFCQRTPQFKTSEWNCHQFDMAMTYFVNVGKVSWCSAGFQRVFDFLSEKGYLEFVPGQSGAPKEFVPPAVDPTIEIREKVKSGELRTTKTRPAEEHETAEILAAKKLPFSELQKQVRKNYKSGYRNNTNV